MNIVAISGRIATPPEQKGNGPVRFNLAVDEYNPKTKQSTAMFVPCSAWGALGTTLSLYGTVGRFVAGSGRLRIDSYTGKDGVKRKTTEVVLMNCELGDKGTGPAEPAPDDDENDPNPGW